MSLRAGSTSNVYSNGWNTISVFFIRLNSNVSHYFWIRKNIVASPTLSVFILTIKYFILRHYLLTNCCWNILSSLRCIFTRMPLLQAIKIPCWILYGVFFTNYGCSQSNMCAIKPCSVKQYSFSRERNSVENHALYDHSFKNLTVQSHKDCFENCAWDCRCKSFNFVTRMKQKNCQLNEQDRYVEPGALKRTIGFSYHEIGIEYNIKVW